MRNILSTKLQDQKVPNDIHLKGSKFLRAEGRREGEHAHLAARTKNRFAGIISKGALPCHLVSRLDERL